MQCSAVSYKYTLHINFQEYYLQIYIDTKIYWMISIKSMEIEKFDHCAAPCNLNLSLRPKN